MEKARVCVLIPTLRNAQQLDVVLQSLNNQDWDGDLEVACVGPTGDDGEEVGILAPPGNHMLLDGMMMKAAETELMPVISELKPLIVISYYSLMMM